MRLDKALPPLDNELFLKLLVKMDVHAVNKLTQNTMHDYIFKHHCYYLMNKVSTIKHNDEIFWLDEW